MNRLDAYDYYIQAMKLGKKYYNECILSGRYPYPQVLDEICNESLAAGRVDIGVIDIPADLICGTKTAGRQTVFAANFMPLAGEETEFASKWMNLCNAHLSDEGIRDPIKCYEYLGRFYVEEGNKRVSVLKSFGARSIPGSVTRIIPAWSEDPEIRMYYEFMEFYSLSRLYTLKLSKRGSYRRLQAALGFDATHKWTDEERRRFDAGFFRFREIYDRQTGESEKAGDTLLMLLQIFSLAEVRDMTQSELAAAIEKVRTDVSLQSLEEPIDVSMETEVAHKNAFSKFLDAITLPDSLNIAFVHEFRPESSAWIAAHEQGRANLESELKDKVRVTALYAPDFPDTDALMEAAASGGADVIFATTPSLIAACRRAALRHPDIKILNCSVSMPFPEVRTYYSRIYEGKFISGALAGALTRTDRIGYVASNPIFGVPAGINAFALGTRLTNPSAKIILRWSSTSIDTFSELRAEGVDLISNRDIPTADASPDVWGLCALTEDGGMKPIISPVWNWGEMYIRIVKNILAGGWDELSFKNSGRAVNYWWGISSGTVDIRLGDDIPCGLVELAEILREGIASGKVHPFRRRLVDQKQNLRNAGDRDLSPEEILNMDWLCRCVEGSIPTYEELLPIARNIVALQGIHREELAPEKGRIQL